MNFTTKFIKLFPVTITSAQVTNKRVVSRQFSDIAGGELRRQLRE